MAARRIRIKAQPVEMEAVLNDSKTADAIWEALPIEAHGSTWGDEIYFSVGVRASEEDPQETVELGDLGYWPPGSAFCIFFGPTPASQGDEIRPASPVNPIGKLDGDPTFFKQVQSGTMVAITRVDD